MRERRRRPLLPWLGAVLLLSGAVQVAGMVDLGAAPPPASEGLLAGCTDVPEAVALAQHLGERSARLERFLAELDRRKAEIALAEGTLTAKLRQLKAVQAGPGSRTQMRQDVREDIDRVIAVYDAMKPKQAAAVIGSLPPEFAAEILMRVDPAIGAEIISAVEPTQAAILTTHMSARRAPSN